MNIGQFSYSTGLSIKTLRYYDSIGLLPAAEVDASSGYRSYRAAQLQDAALLRVLRASGMGTPAMRRALEHPEELEALLAQRRVELAAQRELEDWALDEAPSWQSLDVSGVETRSCEPQHWVGVAVPFDLRQSDDEEAGAAFEASFESLVNRFCSELAARKLLDGPGGAPFWMEYRSDAARPSRICVAYCLGVAEPARPDFQVDGAQVEAGTLPQRTEAFVRASMSSYVDAGAVAGAAEGASSPAERLPGGVLPPREGIALAKVAEDAGADDSFVRQRTLELEGEPVLEWSVTLSN